jgi:hypothetical protein
VRIEIRVRMEVRVSMRVNVGMEVEWVLSIYLVEIHKELCKEKRKGNRIVEGLVLLYRYFSFHTKIPKTYTVSPTEPSRTS